MMSHETNTFSNVPTDRGQFEARNLHYGGEIVEAFRGTGTCLGGMIAAAERRGARLVPSVAAAASPAGLVTRDIYEHVKERMLGDLKAAGALDGVLLDLHGPWFSRGSMTARAISSRPCGAWSGPRCPSRSPSISTAT